MTHIVGTDVSTEEDIQEINAALSLEEVPQSDSVRVEVSDIKKAPDGGWGWFCVLGCLLSHLIIGGIERSGGVIYLELHSKFEGSSASAVSWIFSLNTALRQCLGPIVGALCGRFGCRAVVMTGGALSCLGLVLSAFPPVLEYLHFSFGILTGVGFALAYAPSVIIVGQYFNKYRGMAVGIGVSGIGIGSFAIAPLSELMLSFYGYSGAMLILAGISANLSVGGALFRPLKDNFRSYHSRSQNSAHEDDHQFLSDESQIPNLTVENTTEGNTHSKSDVQQYNLIEQNRTNLPGNDDDMQTVQTGRNDLDEAADSSQSSCMHNFVKKYLDITLLKDVPFLSFCVGMFLFSIAFQASLVFLPALATARGVSKEQAALIIAIIGVTDTVGRILAGILFDRPGILPIRCYLYNLDVLFVAIVTFLSTVVTSFPGFVAIALFYGLVTGMYISQKSVVIVDLVGQEVLSSSFGLLIWFQGVGSLIGPPISGVFRDSYNRYDEAFYFGGSVTVLASLIMFGGNIISSRRKNNLKNK